MIDLEEEKKHFKNHRASLQDCGSVKILDFRNPKSGYYGIRFLFDESCCRLYISGDLGHLVASNYWNMRFEKFEEHYAKNPGYFRSKINCIDRAMTAYYYSAAEEDLKEIINENLDEYIGKIREWAQEQWGETEEDDNQAIDSFVEEALSRFSVESGLDWDGVRFLEETLDSEFWEVGESIGRRSTGIIELYLMAYELAMEDLRKQESENGN